MVRSAVIGGGWAGCSAAVELAQAGRRVTLFEASRTLGGRARRVDLNALPLDNGQHIMLGAYTSTLALMRRLGIDPAEALLTLPLQMRYPRGSGMDFVAPRLPAPIHLLAALLRVRGLDVADRLALARFSTTARWMGWQLYQDCTVSELLARFDQTERLTRLMWRPLCIAALNTPPERASAQVFLNVLRDSLGARRSASDMLIPRLDLGRLIPEQAAHCIAEAAGSVRLGHTVRAVEPAPGGWSLRTGESDREVFDEVVVATHPAQAAALLKDLADTSSFASFDYEAITTCYLQYDRRLRLEQPFFALPDDPSRRHWGQFVFDRGWLSVEQAGLLAVVISASGPALASGSDVLAESVSRQLADVLGQPQLGRPQWTKTISEKRATYACTPGLVRPQNATGRPGLVIAGDYTAGDYPATLEAAVRSGLGAAGCLLGSEPDY